MNQEELDKLRGRVMYLENHCRIMEDCYVLLQQDYDALAERHRVLRVAAHNMAMNLRKMTKES